MPSTFRRQVTALIDRHLSPAAQSAKLAAFAITKREEVISRGQAPNSYRTYVDGRLGAPEAAVRPTGAILYRFNLIGEAAAFALAYAIARSPVGKVPMPRGKTRRFKESWFVAVDGKRWAGEMRAIPAGAEVMVVNDQPYSRKVEVGAIRTSGFKLVEDARQATLRRFPTMAVEKTFVLLPGGYVLKSNGRRVAGRRPNKSQRAGERLTYPAVIIKARR